MSEFIVIAVFVALAMLGLACLFGKKAFKKWRERKWVKCGIAAVCALGASALVLYTLYHCVVLTSLESLFGVIMFSIPVGSVLSLVAMFYVKGIGKKFLLFFAPAPYWIVLFFILMSASYGAELPLLKTEVKYQTQEDVKALLGVDDLPEMEFSKAANASCGNKVFFELKNKADSTELYEVFKQLKAEHPLQICDVEYCGDMYMLANNEKEEYVNIAWQNDGLFIIYGNIWGRDGVNKEIFDSIQAPFPKDYKYLTFMAEQYGPDWTHDERIVFDKPVSLEWLEKVKAVAKTNEHWNFNEDKQSYNFGFDYGGIDEPNTPRIFTRIKLYKNLKGKRKIADINWGDY